MEEKANRRFIFFCTNARTFPTVMVSTETIDSILIQSGEAEGVKMATNTRSTTTNPAAFDAVERKPAIGVGAPSYTSGAQKWNGKAEILKLKPTKINNKLPNTAILGN